MTDHSMVESMFCYTRLEAINTYSRNQHIEGIHMTRFHFGINFAVRSTASQCWVFVHGQNSDRNVLRIISYFFEGSVESLRASIKKCDERKLYRL